MVLMGICVYFPEVYNLSFKFLNHITSMYHIYIYMYLCIFSFLIHWFTNNSICLRFTYLSICWCTYLLIHIFICLFMYLFVYSFDNSFFVTQCGWSFMSRGRWNSDSSPSRGLSLLPGFFLCQTFPIIRRCHHFWAMWRSNPRSDATPLW